MGWSRGVSTSTLLWCDDTSECARASILTTLSLVTCVIALWQITRVQEFTKNSFHYQLLILYAAVAQTALQTLHYTFVRAWWLILIAFYFKVVQFSLVSLFYTLLACQLMRRTHLRNRLVKPLFLVILAALTAAFLSFMILNAVSGKEVDCRSDFFVMLSSTAFILTAVFATAGVVISWRLNRVGVSHNYRREKNKQLWTLIIVNFFSSSWNLAYDLYVRHAAHDCDDYFEESQVLHSMFRVLTRIISHLVPVWAILWVFYTLQRKKVRSTPNALRENDGGSGGGDVLRSPLLDASIQSSTSPIDIIAAAAAVSYPGSLSGLTQAMVWTSPLSPLPSTTIPAPAMTMESTATDPTDKTSSKGEESMNEKE